jgi:hypothetical protein
MENERFGLVFTKTGSTNSGTGFIPSILEHSRVYEGQHRKQGWIMYIFKIGQNIFKNYREKCYLLIHPVNKYSLRRTRDKTRPPGHQ